MWEFVGVDAGNVDGVDVGIFSNVFENVGGGFLGNFEGVDVVFWEKFEVVNEEIF
jgi:hypothetical protein